MNCREAQGLITAFINDELNINEQEEFIDHVESCGECREELEVYYALLTAMKQLDEDRHLSNDFSRDLKEKIESAQERIIHLRYNYYRKKGVLIMIILSMTIFFSLYHYLIPKEEINTVTESRFRLRTSFMEDRFDRPSEELDRYFEGLEGNRIIEEIE